MSLHICFEWVTNQISKTCNNFVHCDNGNDNDDDNNDNIDNEQYICCLIFAAYFIYVHGYILSGTSSQASILMKIFTGILSYPRMVKSILKLLTPSTSWARKLFVRLHHHLPMVSWIIQQCAIMIIQQWLCHLT